MLAGSSSYPSSSYWDFTVCACLKILASEKETVLKTPFVLIDMWLVFKVYGGMRGITGLITETSHLDPNEVSSQLYMYLL